MATIKRESKILEKLHTQIYTGLPHDSRGDYQRLAKPTWFLETTLEKKAVLCKGKFTEETFHNISVSSY